jgi:hypothetical protein
MKGPNRTKISLQTAPVPIPVLHLDCCVLSDEGVQSLCEYLSSQNGVTEIGIQTCVRQTGGRFIVSANKPPGFNPTNTFVKKHRSGLFASAFD